MEYLGVFSVLFLMLGALGLMAWMVRRFGLLPGTVKHTPGNKELEIVASKVLDARNRLVVVRWRGRDILLAAGQNGVRTIGEDKPDFAGMVELEEGEKDKGTRA